MIKKNYLPFLILIFLFTNCSVIKLLKKEKGSDVFYKSRAQITIYNGVAPINFSAEIGFTIKDSFHIEVKGPFGISAGEVFIINKRFIYINKLERIVFSGENDDGKLETIFQIPISPDILGKLPLISHLILQNEQMGREYSYFKNIIKDKKSRVTEATYIKNENIITFSFKKFKKIDNINFPHNILIEQENGNYMQISFQKIQKTKNKFPQIPIIEENFKQL